MKTWGEFKRQIEAAGIDDATPVTDLSIRIDAHDIGGERLARIIEQLAGSSSDGFGMELRAVTDSDAEAIRAAKSRPA